MEADIFFYQFWGSNKIISNALIHKQYVRWSFIEMHKTYALIFVLFTGLEPRTNKSINEKMVYLILMKLEEY